MQFNASDRSHLDWGYRQLPKATRHYLRVNISEATRNYSSSRFVNPLIIGA
jgi:hypothetical protein